VATCLEIDPELLAGLPRIQQDQGLSRDNLLTMNKQRLLSELHKREQDCGLLQDYANILLGRIRDSQPETLHSIMAWLDQATDLNSYSHSGWRN
jgi:hypothetical protein